MAHVIGIRCWKIQQDVISLPQLGRLRPTLANPILANPFLAIVFGQPILANPFLAIVFGQPILANPFLANPFFVCVVVVGFGVGKCSQMFVFACLLCVCVCCVVCCVFQCCCVLCCVCVCVWWVCSGPFRRTPLRRTPLRRTPLRRTPLRRTAQNFALFFHSPATVFILFSLSCWSFSLNFGGVFEDRDPQMCTFGLSGCRVKPRRPHQTGPPGLAHDSLRTPNVHI